MTSKFATGSIHLQLADDGLGFDPMLENEGYGLISIKERVDGMGGQFILGSKQEQGTEILLILNFKPKEGL
jgi:two-component system NarL family sensor kinase